MPIEMTTAHVTMLPVLPMLTVLPLLLLLLLGCLRNEEDDDARYGRRRRADIVSSTSILQGVIIEERSERHADEHRNRFHATNEAYEGRKKRSEYGQDITHIRYPPHALEKCFSLIRSSAKIFSEYWKPPRPMP